MRINNQILCGIEIIIACYCFFLVTFIMGEYSNISIFVNILFYAFMVMVSFSFFTLKTHKRTVNKLIFKTVIIDNLIYYIILFVMGLFWGFVKNSYSLRFLDVLGNILPIILLVGCKELFRQVMVKNLKNKKFLFILFILEIIILSLVSNKSLYNISSGSTFFKLLGLFIIPTIMEELLLTYLVYNIDCKVTIVYSLFQKLWIYVMPIIPDISYYFQSILYLVFPTIVFLQVYKSLLKYDKFKENITSTKIRLWINTPIVIFVIVLIVLISGITKYQLVSVATGSMEPNISRGDAVIIRKMSSSEKEKLEEGRVIAFIHDNEVVLHRIIEIKKSKVLGLTVVQTKGDANKEADPYEILLDDIIGTVNIKIPLIGYPTLWFNEG